MAHLISQLMLWSNLNSLVTGQRWILSTNFPSVCSILNSNHNLGSLLCDVNCLNNVPKSHNDNLESWPKKQLSLKVTTIFWFVSKILNPPFIGIYLLNINDTLTVLKKVTCLMNDDTMTSDTKFYCFLKFKKINVELREKIFC